jgi:hypothetical protein
MAYVDTYLSREDRFAIGVETATNRHYVSFPVSNRKVDYLEYYALTPDQYRDFLGNHEAALNFVESCRRRERDELLIYKPGTDRGTPT